MTLIAGINLGDGVGVVGDSRGVLLDDSGKILEANDDYQKVYNWPPFAIGISGDAQSAGLLLKEYAEKILLRKKKDFLMARCCDESWVVGVFRSLHKNLLDSSYLSRKNSFCLVLAAFDYRKYKECREPMERISRYNIIFHFSYGMSYLSKFLSRPKPADGPDSLVIAIEFPSYNVYKALPGEVIKTGSGSYIDNVLVKHCKIYIGDLEGARVSTRFKEIAQSFSLFHFTAKDPTFNATAHAILFEGRKIGFIGTVFNRKGFGDKKVGNPINSTFWEKTSESELRSDIKYLSEKKIGEYYETMFEDENWYIT